MLTFKQFKDLGISTFPTHNYKPVVTWSKYRSEMPTDEECVEWESKGYDVGVVTGELSGNLYCIDFDLKYDLVGVESIISRWTREVEIVTDSLLPKLVVCPTRNAGWHAYFRTESTVGGNEKFASRFPTEAELKDEPHLKTKVLLESRGEGGMCFQHNMPLKNSWDKLPVLTESEVNILITSAKILNEVHVERKESTYAAPKASVGGITPLDDYDASNDGSVCLELLLEHGWSVVNETTEGWRLARPGKTHGISATLDIIPDRFYVFSSSTEFDVEAPYKYSAVYAMLEHGGDFSAATKELAKEGYGEQLDKEERVELLNKMMGKSDDVEFTDEQEAAILSRLKSSKECVDAYVEYVKSGHSYRVSDRFKHAMPLMKDISPGQVVGIAGSSGSGKSLVLDQFNKDYVNLTETYGMLGSLEMPHADQGARSAMSLALPGEDGMVSKEDTSHLLMTNQDFYNKVVSDGSRVKTLDDSYDIDEIFEIAKVYKNYLARQGKTLSFVSIDFQSLLEGGADVDKQAAIAQKLKKYAKKLNVIVFILQQFNGSMDKYDEPTNTNVLSGRRELFMMLDFSFMIWKSRVYSNRIRFKSMKERWQKEAIIDLVSNGMYLTTDIHVKDDEMAAARAKGNKSI